MNLAQNANQLRLLFSQQRNICLGARQPRQLPTAGAIAVEGHPEPPGLTSSKHFTETKIKANLRRESVAQGADIVSSKVTCEAELGIVQGSSFGQHTLTFIGRVVEL